MVESEEMVEQGLSELEKNAIARRKRLMEMRARLAGNNLQNDDEERGNNSEEGGGENQNVSLLFRSYKPINAENSTVQLGSIREEIKSIEKNVADQIEATKETKVTDTLDLNTLAPRKVDWDLRRGIQDKLDKLDRRTSKSIIQLIRMRMNEEGNKEESNLLATAVGSIGGEK